MGCLASALQKYYIRKGGKIVFVNGKTLNELAIEMWEAQHFSQIDASVLSRVINGKRLFTIPQLTVFSSLLHLPQIDVEFLLFCLQKDHCSRENIPIDDYYIPKTEIFPLIKDLVLFATNAQHKKDIQSVDKLTMKIDSIIQILCTTKNTLIEKKELQNLLMQHSLLKIKKYLHNPHSQIYISHNGNLEKIYTSIPVLKLISPRSYGNTMQVHRTLIPHIEMGENIVQIYPILRHLQPGSDLVLPVIINKKIVGILSFLARKDRIYTQEDICRSMNLLKINN